MFISNKISIYIQCNSEVKFVIFWRTCENFNLYSKCFEKKLNDKISFSYFIHEHLMKELNMSTENVYNICKKSGIF